jgi:hypothetical protein
MVAFGITCLFYADACATNTIVRFVTFNASLNRNNVGELTNDFSLPPNPSVTQSNRIRQAKTVAEIIQRANPDVLLINEFDYYTNYHALNLFHSNFLTVAQNTLNQSNTASPVHFAYRFVEPSNTGVPSGHDLDNNGSVGGGNDAFGFGSFPGQFGMAVFSKYPIVTNRVRTFQFFLWKDMPNALLPDDPATPAPRDWYSAAELNVVRLSSKSHWDVPIDINGTIVHALVSHPTPPVFDGPEDRNGKRNHDEIRFWADYIAPERAGYIYDDKGGRGGLAAGERFIIMGDQNADPFDGDSVANAATQLLAHRLIDASLVPTSTGAVEQAAIQGGANATHRGPAAHDTADFADTSPGNVRVDYVLPSVAGLTPVRGAVFWPSTNDANFRLVGTFGNPNYFSGFPSSDHKLVWLDVRVDLLLKAELINDGAQLLVSWPAAASNCHLQSTFTLGPGALWEHVTNMPMQHGSMAGVTVEANITSRFFRLLCP